MYDGSQDRVMNHKYHNKHIPTTIINVSQLTHATNIKFLLPISVVRQRNISEYVQWYDITLYSGEEWLPLQHAYTHRTKVSIYDFFVYIKQQHSNIKQARNKSFVLQMQ
uniref:Uncharacterized protein n=1 Tax=Cacopsylla melanoneura TaxID=428564 RepID=A0A8D8W2N4_9HEMI